MNQKDEDAASILLEGKIIQTAMRIQNYLYRLIEIEEQTGNQNKAEEIAEITVKMVDLMGLWHYGTVVPHLLIALFGDIANNITHAFISEIETKEEYEFFRDNEEVKKTLRSIDKVQNNP